MKNKTKDKLLVIVGTGETAEIAYEYFTYDSNYEVVAFSVSEKFLKTSQLMGLPVIPIESLHEEYPPETVEAFVAISSNHLNRDREKVFLQMNSKKYKLASYVSSRAFVWHNAQIGENCFIFENNTIQHYAVIGNNVTLWSGNHIGHRSIIQDHCFISSHVVISGFCEIGKYSFIGVNVSVADNVKIASDNFIAAGSVITKNTKENSIYRGNPARPSDYPAKRYCKVEE